MSSAPSLSTSRRSRPPLWLVEGLDVVEQRRPAMIAVTLGVIVVGALVAMLAPSLVPPVPMVGAAVGLAALLLGLAVAIALDAADLRLRGPRHVGAAGGELVAVLPTIADRGGAATLASAVLEAREPGSPLLLGLAASGRDVRPTTTWTDALATALEAEGVSVLCIDLASGQSAPPGLLEVVRDGVTLATAVSFGPEPRLARLGAGADQRAALAALGSLPGRLPRDLDVLLVALPMAASRQVVAAVRSLDHVLIVAQRDRTSRVELIAGLDALEAAGTRAQVALLDDQTAARLAGPYTADTVEADTDAGSDTADAAGAAPDDHENAATEAAHDAVTDDDQADPAASDADPDALRPVVDPTDPIEPTSPVADRASSTSQMAEPRIEEGSRQRDVSIVDGAAEAAAIALSGVPLAMPSGPGPDPVHAAAIAGGDEIAASDPDTTDAIPANDPDTTDPTPAGDPDTTDPIPALGLRPTISEAEAENDELLRTTAQLSNLLGGLDPGGDQRSADTP